MTLDIKFIKERKQNLTQTYWVILYDVQRMSLTLSLKLIQLISVYEKNFHIVLFISNTVWNFVWMEAIWNIACNAIYSSQAYNNETNILYSCKTMKINVANVLDINRKPIHVAFTLRYVCKCMVISSHTLSFYIRNYMWLKVHRAE